jgi:hypothetical protein
LSLSPIVIYRPYAARRDRSHDALNDGDRVQRGLLLGFDQLIAEKVDVGDGAVLHNSSRGSASMPGPTVVADATLTFKPKYSMVVDFTHTDPDGEPEITRPIPQNPGPSFSAPNQGRTERGAVSPGPADARRS